MYPLISRDKIDSVSLIANSNIQFLDYEVILGVEDYDSDDQKILAEAYEKTHFMKAFKAGKRVLRRYKPCLINKNDEEERYLIEENAKELSKDELDDDSHCCVNLDDALYLYNGVWFPLPCFDDTSNSVRFGPVDWCRCRVVQIPLSGADKDRLDEKLHKKARKYHITIAFDTKIAPNKTERYIIPTLEDVDRTYTIKTHGELLDRFLLEDPSGKWVNDWIKDILATLFDDRFNKKGGAWKMPDNFDDGTSDEIRKKDIALKSGLDVAYYLSMLSFIENYCDLKSVKIISRKDNAVDVNLVLDIGNSRSCGLLYEIDNSIEESPDKFESYKLALRDINSPDKIYADPFASRIEFAKASFSFNDRQSCQNSDFSFVWPSVVRVGTEATVLASHSSLSEGRTGTSSPKRYLWNIYGSDNSQNDWCFNNFTYQVTDYKEGSSDFIIPDSLRLRQKRREEVTDSHIGLYLNSNGDAVFALEEGDEREGFSSHFSYKATMTFMLLEIFLQALTQINSYASRAERPNTDKPRVLKNIILTTPPSMPSQEKEIFRLCAFEAVGILWKVLGYDKNCDPCVFNFADEKTKQCNPDVPNLLMSWNEAECCQTVYLYNETQKNFGGDCKGFIKSLRRSVIKDRIFDKRYDSEELKHALENDGHAPERSYTSARIATIDIGGGTTDLVIRDYSFRDDRQNEGSYILPSNILSEGFKNAGDDITKQLIDKCIINTLKTYLDSSGANGVAICNALFRGSDSDSDSALRKQVIQQIFIPVIYRIVFYLENYSVDGDIRTVKGSLYDFLNGTETGAQMPEYITKPDPYGNPETDVIEYVKDKVSKNSAIKNFNILDLKLDIDLDVLNRSFINGGMGICSALSVLCNLLWSYNVDVLLLSGRPSKIPGIREFFMQRLPLPKSRIIAMHQYHCDGWYPFNDVIDSTIKDPKTTASVGALLNLIKTDSALLNRLTNFRIYAGAVAEQPQIRYLGILDNKSIMKDDSVYYIYKPYKIDEGEDQELYRDYIDHMIIYPEHDLVSDRIDGVSFEGEFESLLSPTGEGLSEVKMELTRGGTIGYRQLGSSNIQSTPLYNLQILTDLKRSKSVRRALNIMEQAYDIYDIFPDERGEIKQSVSLNGDIIEEYGNKVLELKLKESYLKMLLETDRAGFSPAVDALLEYDGEDSYIADLKNRYAALKGSVDNACIQDVDTMLASQKQGIASRLFGKNKRESERNILINEAVEKALSALEMDLKEEISSKIEDLENEKFDLSSDIFGAVYEKAMQRAKKRMAAAQDVMRPLKRVTVTLDLLNVIGYVKDPNNIVKYDDSNRNKMNKGQGGDIRYAMFKGNKFINPVQHLYLDEILSDSNDDLTEAFELSLQTVNENDRVYWIDSGRIIK